MMGVAGSFHRSGGRGPPRPLLGLQPSQCDNQLSGCARHLVQTLEGARDEFHQELLICEDDTLISRH